ncbi:MAG TPA: hypothetical protein VFK85_10750 [Anaeromyxobacteraceae bacterium]|nr:hypothetical protein [Anaeromyxobacteraceae bacterium]
MKAMHEVQPFRLKTLLKRYDEARRVRAGVAWRFEQNFLVAVDPVR